jgi:diguanylate cyclase (GGDEF)-like protein
MSAEAGGGIGVPRHSTVIALSYAATALVLVALWGLMVGPTTQLQPFVFTALIAAAFLAERIAVPVSPRTWYTISTPIVLLTGLVGGPIAGSIAGAATAVGDEAGTWRRRAAYGGLNSVQGFAAGLAGMTHLGGSNRSILCASIAAITVLASNIAGRVLIGHVRRIPVKPLARPGNIVDAIEMLVAIPVLALLLQSYDTSGPALMLITIAAMVASLYVVMKTRDRYLARIEEHFADARTDRLTGAPNRRAYDEELERAVARVQRGEHLVALLVFDIDHFKSVNTTYGWTGGDELLRAITGRVGDILRASDHLSRRGGEEFCVIAPGVPDQVALRELAEKVRGIVRMAPFAIVGSSVDVTVSVGATLIDGSLTPTEADGLANAALSRAKDGRDRVVILPEPDAGGDREECGLGSPLRPPQASALSS